MIGFSLSQFDYDGEAVLKRMAKAERRALQRIGFETRASAMKSIQPGVGPSSPGSPPHDQTGTLRRFIRYQYDKQSNSVVIGPKYLRKKSKNAPGGLERGEVSINFRKHPIRVAARPFMTPAFEIVKRQMVPRVFANSLN